MDVEESSACVQESGKTLNQNGKIADNDKVNVSKILFGAKSFPAFLIIQALKIFVVK